MSDRFCTFCGTRHSPFALCPPSDTARGLDAKRETVLRLEQWYYDMRDYEMNLGPLPAPLKLADLRIALGEIPYTETAKLEAA